MKAENLYYFVDDISTPFVIKDIEMLSRNYPKVIIFSTEILIGKEILPKNVMIIEEFIKWRNFNGKKLLFKNFIELLKIYLRESIALKKVLPIKRSMALLTSNKFKANEILKNIELFGLDLSKPSIFYSFWFYDCIYLALLKKEFNSIGIVSRAHSGDLYEDHISIKNNLHFRHFQLEKLDAIFPVSRMGTEYLRIRYPMAKCNIQTIFLGTKDPGIINPFDSENFVLVSCADIRHHKRINKIAEFLINIDFPLTWFHFGNENLDSNDPSISEYLHMKEALNQNKNIRYYSLGHLDNIAIFDFYSKTPVTLFISLSEVEGIPVSMMEAISFGIPIISTDVGGCRELVNDETGILISLASSSFQISEIISNFRDSKLNNIKFRQGVREFWKNNFNDFANYNKLFENLDILNNKDCNNGN